MLNDHIGDKFPLQAIIDSFKGNVDKNYSFDDDIINSFLEEEYGGTVCGLTLLLLYPNVALEHGKAIAEDHMHPKTIFESEEKLNALGLSPTQDVFFKDKKNYNSVLNLQLLEETINKSKGDNSLLSWATSNRKSKIDLYVDDDISLDIKDFEAFISSRKKNLTAKLKIILNI